MSTAIVGGGSKTSKEPAVGDVGAQQIPQLVLQLVNKLVPHSPKPQLQLAQYTLRILGSRLPTTPIQDEYALIALMKKFLINTRTMKDAVQLDNLYNNLMKLGALNQLKYASSSSSAPVTPTTLRFSMLYFLYQSRMSTGTAALQAGHQSVLVSNEVSSHLLLADLSLNPAPSSALPSKLTLTNGIKSGIEEKKSVKMSKGRIGGDEVNEWNIVRDLIYVLQGLEGEYFKYNSHEDKYEIVNRVSVQRSVRILAYRVSELGCLFGKVKKYLESTQISSAASNVGLIEQSFREGVAEEVRSYYRMISVLEAQVNVTENQELNRMSLRKLAVWTSEPLRRMKWLYMVIQNDMCSSTDSESRNNFINNNNSIESGRSTGKMTTSDRHFVSDLAASRMHQLTQMRLHGDPHVQSLGRTLEIYTSKPVLTMIQNWVFQGVLNDPYKEFFVIKNDSIAPLIPGDVGEVSRIDKNFWLWQEQYLVLHNRIPPFISHKLAHKIMVIGKSINFMKQCCGDADWIAQTTRKVLNQTDSNVTHFDQLRAPIHQLSDEINARLVYLILEKFHLMHHVEAIRKYLFLGQGDLIQVLLESLEPELSLPAGKQYRHNLLPIVDGALRASVAHAWPAYLQERCEIYLPPPHKPGASSIRTSSSAVKENFIPQDGWDVFELSYKLTGPLDAILGTSSVVEQHRAIFRFLWRLRRVQHIMSGTWRLTTNCTRQLSYLVPEINPLMQQVHLLRHQMTHFISNIQYYIMFELVETAWIQLEKDCKTSKSLDEIIEAYSRYVSTIIKSSLVDDPSSTPVSNSPDGHELEESPAAMIWELLDIIRDLDEQVKEIYTSTHEVAVRREIGQCADNTTLDENGEPVWGVSEEDEQLDADFFDHLDNVLFVGVETIADRYKHTFDRLFTSLAQQMRDGDHQFLTNLFQRVNFNSYYASETPQLPTNAESATATLQATLRSFKQPDGSTPSGLSNFNSTTTSRMGAPGTSSSGTSMLSPSAASSDSSYAENVLKQAAAKLRLSNLNASAHQRSASSSKK